MAALNFPGGATGKRICLLMQETEDTRVRFLSILGSGRSPGGGNGTSLQYYFQENSTDRGAWQATVHEVAKGQT